MSLYKTSLRNAGPHVYTNPMGNAVPDYLQNPVAKRYSSLYKPDAKRCSYLSTKPRGETKRNLREALAVSEEGLVLDPSNKDLLKIKKEVSHERSLCPKQVWIGGWTEVCMDGWTGNHRLGTYMLSFVTIYFCGLLRCFFFFK